MTPSLRGSEQRLVYVCVGGGLDLDLGAPPMTSKPSAPSALPLADNTTMELVGEREALETMNEELYELR